MTHAKVDARQGQWYESAGEAEYIAVPKDRFERGKLVSFEESYRQRGGFGLDRRREPRNCGGPRQRHCSQCVHTRERGSLCFRDGVGASHAPSRGGRALEFERWSTGST